MPSQLTSVLAISLLPILVVTGTMGATISSEGKIDVGDYVKYHVTIRDLNGAILFTSDADLALAEIAAGSHALSPPEDSPAHVYRAQGGFVELSNGSGFDHVPFLLGRGEGDIIITPPLELPFDSRAPVELPRVIRNVSTTFSIPKYMVDAYVAEQNASLESFHYLGDFPASAEGINATHAEVSLHLQPGQVLRARALDFPVRVLATASGAADLELLLNEGDIFRLKPCAVSIGIDAGRYLVTDANSTTVVLAHYDGRDLLADRVVELEFRILEVNDWPHLLKAKAHAERILERLQPSAASANTEEYSVASRHEYGTKE